MAIMEEEKTDDQDDQEQLIRGLRTLPTLRRMTELLIDEALRRADGNKSAAARLLGISRQALGQRLQRRERERD